MAEDNQRGQPVAEAYRKAHKTYVLTSGLLAAWELVGVTLDTKEKWGSWSNPPLGMHIGCLPFVEHHRQSWFFGISLKVSKHKCCVV